MKSPTNSVLLGAAVVAATAIFALSGAPEESPAEALEAIKAAAAAEPKASESAPGEWAEIWGLEPKPVTEPVLLAKVEDTAWGEVWGLTQTAAADRAPTFDSAAIETASIPARDTAWGEVWGVGADTAPDAVASTIGWGEVWGLEPTPIGVEGGGIETASIPSPGGAATTDEAWGEVWGLE